MCGAGSDLLSKHQHFYYRSFNGRKFHLWLAAKIRIAISLTERNGSSVFIFIITSVATQFQFSSHSRDNEQWDKTLLSLSAVINATAFFIVAEVKTVEVNTSTDVEMRFYLRNFFSFLSFMQFLQWLAKCFLNFNFFMCFLSHAIRMERFSLFYDNHRIPPAP